MNSSQSNSTAVPGSLLRFLLPVLLLHLLLLAGLPYWPNPWQSGQRGVDVELVAIPAPPSEPATAGAAPDTPVSPPADTQTRSQTARPDPPRRLDSPQATAAAQSAGTAVTADPVADAPAPSSTRPEARRTVPAETAPAETAIQTAPANSRHPSDRTAAPAADDAWQDDYRTALRIALARHHHYPARARRFGLSGQATVRFTILRDGRFRDIELAQSSGAELLDQAALATVQRLGHFQPLPDDYSEDSWTVSVPLVYRRS